MIRLQWVIFLVLLLAGCAQKQPGDPTAERIREGRLAASAAFSALEEGNLADFLEGLKRATKLRPAHASLEYHLGRAYLMNGDTLSALSTFENLAKMGVYVSFDDPDLVGLRAISVGQDLEFRLLRNNNPKVASARAFVGSDPNFQAEGIARVDGKWLMASVRQNRIAWNDGATLVDLSPRSALGMKTFENHVWVAATATQEGGASPELVGSSQIVKIDLSTGVVDLAISPKDTLNHWFGDVEISPAGEVFVSDSQAPGIYKVEEDQLIPLSVGDPFTSPQGIAYLNKRLYVADYAAGIFHVDPSTGSAHLIDAGVGVTLLGIDGLIAYDGGLIAIQNGMVPPRVIFVELLTPTTIGAVVTLESNHPDYHDPTVGFVSNDSLFYMANSQWPLFSPSADSTLRKPSIILGLPLDFKVR
ncbi:MAG: hypothetical protein O3B41_03745 [Bacteroidetes bacterium]|nr:hypothetical protein [Bacteroidota bacterium]